jgi:tRNA modification GTPase
MKNTIYALSTVFGKSGVAVIRVSGDHALDVISQMTNIETLYLKPRHAYFSPIHSIVSRETLDHAVVLYFKAPHSFTGEDSVEIQCHGSKAVLSSILDQLGRLPDFRLAEPGEFSKRAFYHNKMDLTEAEGLADLIDAETIEQQRYALRQLDGNLKNLYESWREELLSVYAWLEAFIDFPDEDIPVDVKHQHLNTVFKLVSEMNEHLSTPNYGERLREGFRVVIAGPANAGKSSLMNALLNRQAVIVSEQEGTTRDAVDVNFDLGGYPVIFTDTAGIRNHTSDLIEKQGIDIAMDKIRQADIVLALFDGSCPIPEIFEKIKKESQNKVLYVANKSDRLKDEQCSELKNKGCVLISAKEKTGLDDLFKTIENEIKQQFTSSSSVLITRQRYREAVLECVENLKNFNFEKEIELAAEDIRLAARALGKITGRFEVEEILDKIFGSFCIGK